MLDSYIGSVMNMTADVMTQQNLQSPTSGVITREWLYEQTISCKIEPIKSGGGSNRVDNKRFDMGKHNEYDEKLQLKMKCLIPFSKRWRITNIRSSDGQQVYVELDRFDMPDTIFDVTASHAVLDPFGKVSYYEVTLQRVHIQNDNTSTK
jgi:pyoverdine/dityrosine biosynthesis protein Dit1